MSDFILSLWHPVDEWQLGGNWLQQNGLRIEDSTPDKATIPFYCSLGLIFFAILPLLLTCARCCCTDKENKNPSEVGATTAASLLTTAAAVVVFFSYKCDSVELLQTGIILYYITIALSLVEAILLFCAFGRACCDDQGCGSRVKTFLTYVIQTALLLLSLIVILAICIYGTKPAFESLLSDSKEGQQLLNRLEEAENIANEEIKSHKFSASSN
ncbi:unnamed protein product [Oikopleura dioica]|uniref:Transmembrane protein n=1 Tax=Oikopleura dioica TaxID=34765 RepID=E4WW26_OIKDI|nr:unnamed protein product [Oikopleura dioica]